MADIALLKMLTDNKN